MRVISGSAKRLQLKTLDSIDTRPTTDRIKETLFNIINSQLMDSVFLDLFSGSGGIGIEALSRGAKEAVFVDSNPLAVSIIKDNLNHTKLEDKGKVMSSDAISALHKLDGTVKFDYIFMDPPYHQELEKRTLEYLLESDLLQTEGIIIVEASKDTDFSYLEDWGFTIVKTKEYKTNKHVFLSLVRGGGVC